MTPEDRLTALVERMSGIVLQPGDSERLMQWVGGRALDRGFRTTGAYLDTLRRHPESDEWAVLLGRVTVKESYLFRAPQQFRCLEERLIPDLLKSGRKKIEVWSAGCARGEEPATIGIILARRLRGTGIPWSVVATDVDEEALLSARACRFSGRSLRKVPDEVLDRFFLRKGREYELIDRVRRHLRFERVNVVEEPLRIEGAPFDLVFLRNVLIYFRKSSQTRVVRAVSRILKPDGFLMVGPSESLVHLGDDSFRTENRDGVFVYRPRNRTRSSVEVAGGAISRRERHSDVESGRPQEEAGNSSADDPEAFAREGARLEQIGDLRGALRQYRAALYLDPDLVDVRFRLAKCLEAVGWSGRAATEFRTIRALLKPGRGGRPEGSEDQVSCGEDAGKTQEDPE